VLLASASILAQTNRVPFVNQPLEPMTAAPGSAGFTLTVNGTGFASGSVVNWNGTPLATNVVTVSQLTATVPASLISSAGTAFVTVTNPAPGGGTSNVQFFSVTAPSTNVVFTQYSQNFAGTGLTPTSLANPVLADFNNDGKQDVAFLAFGTTGYLLCIELGNGDSSFQTPNCTPVSPPATGSSQDPYSLVAADFNSDGKLDLALANGQDGTNTISIFIGNGDGTLQPAVNYPAGSMPPLLMAVADFNRDGKLDIALFSTEYNATSLLSILFGNGDGSFQSPTAYTLNFGSQTQLFVGDLNRDGSLDLVFDDASGDSNAGVYIAFGNADGTFNIPQRVVTLGGLEVRAVADLNGDGKLDLAVANQPTPDFFISTVFGNGDGTFQPIVNYPTDYETPAGPLVADVNGDAIPDLVFTRYNGLPNSAISSLSVDYGNVGGTFQSQVNFPVSINSESPSWVGTGDFNGDGKVDALMVSDTGIASPFPAALLFFVQGAFPAITLSAPGLTFGVQAVGTTSSAQAITLTNTGLATLDLSGSTITGTNAGDFAESATTCGATLAVNGSCQISVTFTPLGYGTRSALLQISGNALGGPQNISLTGSTPLGSVAQLSPTNLAFPSQYVGTTGLPQSVTVSNTGSAALTISSVTTSPADFGSLNACGSSVAPGSSCAIGIFFDPTATGTISGTLTLTDNAGGSPQTVTLSGTGQDFSLAPSGPSTATVAPGQTASYTLAVTPGGGFNQTVAMSCSGAPALSTCALSSSSVVLNGSTAAAVNVTITTAKGSAGVTPPFSRPPYGGTLPWLAFPGTLALATLLSLARWRRERSPQILYGLVFLCLLSIGVTMSACGGGSSSSGGSGGGTQPGTYDLMLTGTFTSGSTTLTHNTKLTLVVVQ